MLKEVQDPESRVPARKFLALKGRGAHWADPPESNIKGLLSREASTGARRAILPWLVLPWYHPPWYYPTTPILGTPLHTAPDSMHSRTAPLGDRADRRFQDVLGEPLG